MLLAFLDLSIKAPTQVIYVIDSENVLHKSELKLCIHEKHLLDLTVKKIY